MARNIEDIQRDIERTRRQLAGTLDELANRSQPKALAADVKVAATDKFTEPKTQAILAGVAAVVIGGIALAVFSSRRRSSDIKELQRLLAERR